MLGRAMGFAARFDDEGERVLDAVRDRLGIDPGPRRVGRFELRRRLGAGAMGVVFLAEDPQLERAVALKLLRPGRDDAQSCARLRREAKALARLRHPNIVAVHELGVHEDQVFVAMEYVEGEDLREWLSSGSRSTADVLARFIDAGHGLAAAHAAGIVHRDFKPDNVLVGEDGRTQVADFGLAAGRLDSPTTSDVSALGETGDNSLTRTGAVLGTPAYMAPEALRGAPATIASDQFSFCVSLYEGLFGARPFRGASIDALIDAVARGPRPRAPRGPQVPRHVWAALRRGLATNPADRWPDMRSLVGALCPRAKRRRRVAVMLLAFALGSTGAVAWAWEPSCGQAGQRIRETWNEPRAAALRSALEGASLADGDAIAYAVEAAFDHYAVAWDEQARDACEAARVREDQSDMAHDLRMQCLERRRTELDAVIGAIAGMSEAKLAHASAIASSLIPVHVCADVMTLSSEDPLPDAPQLRTETLTSRSHLARARGLLMAGSVEDASVELGHVERSPSVRLPAVAAEYSHALGQEQLLRGQPRQALASFRDAFAAAQRGKAPRVAVEAALSATATAVQLSDVAEGRRWIWLAEPLVDRFPDSDQLRSGFDWDRGLIEYLDGDYEAAEGLFARAQGHAWVRKDRAADLAQMRSLALRKLGREAEALEMLREADRILVVAYGVDTPQRASVANSLGNALSDAGQAEAERYYLLSLRAYDRGPERSRAMGGHPLHNLGRLYASRGEHEFALVHFEAALRRFEPVLGEDHPDRADVLLHRGRSLLAVGRTVAALDSLERSAAILDAASRPVPDELVEALEAARGAR